MFKHTNCYISFEFKWSICNIIPHELVEILRKTPLQEDTEDDQEGVELSNLANILYDEFSNESTVIIMTSYQCDTPEKIISVDDDGSASLSFKQHMLVFYEENN